MSNKKIWLASQQVLVDEATALFNLKKSIIESFTDDIPMPSLLYKSGYCADACIQFSDGKQFATIVRELTPIPCVFVQGGSVAVKPVESLRDSDGGQRRRIYPVISVSKGKAAEDNIARWWTKCDGRTIEVSVSSLEPGAIADLVGSEMSRYEPGGYKYSTGSTNFLQLRKKRKSDHRVLTPLEKWKQTWVDWYDSKGFNKKQSNYLNVFSARLLNDLAFELPARVPEKELSCWDRMGDFWEVFNEAEVAEIVAFVNDRAAALPAARADVLKEMEVAKAWFTQFFASRGNPFPTYISSGANNFTDDATETFGYLFQKETGLGGNINWCSQRKGGVEVGYTLDTEHVRLLCSYQSDAPAIDWEALSEYY